MQPNRSNRFLDFIGGLFLVAGLHFVFLIVWIGIAYVLVLTIPFFNQYYNVFFLGIPLFFLGLTQILYLLPAMLYFSKKQRDEVAKGIVCGGVVTALLNGSCFGAGVSGGILPLVALGLSLFYIGYMVNQRYQE
jgi:hypothetical protein